MNFGKITLNQSIKTMQNCSIWIQVVSLFIIQTEEFYKDVAVDVKKWFYTSNYIGDDKRPLPRDMNKKVSG